MREMLRPSRPMMRPFISSFGSETALTVDFRGVIGGNALYRQGHNFLRLAIGIALGTLSRISRSAVGRVGLRLLLHAANELGFGSSTAESPASCSRRSGVPRRPFYRARSAVLRRTSLCGRDRWRTPSYVSLSRVSTSSNLRSRTTSRSCRRFSSPATSSRRRRYLGFPRFAGAHGLFLPGEHLDCLREAVGLTLGARPILA